MNVRDLDGLAASCRRGRTLGHLGRSAIHPDQLDVIEQTYLPTEREVELARATVEKLEASGVGEVEGGLFVDPALAGSAKTTIALADAYGTGS
jgi:citrate lyase subunit beta/citryl-CoA lyase